MNKNIKKIVFTALFAALACVTTMSIRIPTPGTGGYIHPGDAVVILSGVILGPSYGFLAAGIGSAMADLLGGYFVYVPITFLIKGMIALVSGRIFKRISREGSKKSRLVAVALGGVTDMLFVSVGYFLCEIPMYGLAAAGSIPANLIQGASGLVLSLALYPILLSVPDLKRMAFSNRFC